MPTIVGIMERVMGYDLPSTEGPGPRGGGGGVVREETDMVTTRQNPRTTYL